ncbi:unnamed protein product, partial [Hapterophycus canaliculatus]
DPSALLRIIDAQSERATARAEGFSLAARLLDGPGSDRATASVLRAVTDGLREHGAAEIATERLHFMPGVECCDPKSKSALFKSTAEFLRQCSLVLGQERLGDRGAAGNSVSRRCVLVHALRAVTMDYDWGDHDILQESQLLPLISSLLDDADRSVANAASGAVQVLYRCTVPSQEVEDNSIPEHPLD